VVDRRKLPFDPIAEAKRQWEGHAWESPALGMSIVTSIMRLQQVFLTQANAILRPFGLTFARYEVLMLLTFSSQGSMPLGKMGERLQVNAASVTNLVDRLATQGLLTKSPNPADGRGTLAHLTPAGRETAQRATKEMNTQLFADLGPDRVVLEELFHVLGTIRQAAGDFE
jgi:DNA-binding MarR family transcriptional regulator